MAEDIKVIWNNDYQEGDIQYNKGDLTRELGLETAVMMSLYTDRQASTDDILPDSNSIDRRGWWGDQITDFDGDQIGSRLWLLERSKITDDIISTAKFYIEESLQWMIDDEVVQNIEIEVERQNRADGSGTLAALIQLEQSDGKIVALKYDDLWKNTGV